jgi:hypothetical protein
MTNSTTTFSKKVLFTFVLLFHTAFLFATDQIPDLIICNGTTLYISGTFDEEFPLYPLLQDEKYNCKMEKYDNNTLKLSACHSTGFYRGYQAIWELYNGVVYLKAVLDCCTKEPLFELETIFGKDIVTERGVQAFWLNDSLSICSRPISVFTLFEDIKMIGLKLKYGRIQKKK